MILPCIKLVVWKQKTTARPISICRNFSSTLSSSHLPISATMFWLLTSLLLPQHAIAVNNGYAKTPIMGYNSYNDVACSPTSSWMNQTMQALSSNGLSQLGYNHFQIDCGWQGYDRLANGSITYDSNNFPDGIRPLSNLARSLGLKWSMYTDQGKYACDTSSRLRPGSLGYEKQDAAMFAAWNTEYVKVREGQD